MNIYAKRTKYKRGGGTLCPYQPSMKKSPSGIGLTHSYLFFAAITCDIVFTQTAVDGVTPTCTNTNAFGSSCSFGCSSGKGLSDNTPITCGGDDQSTTGTWSAAAPTCSGKIYAISKESF